MQALRSELGGTVHRRSRRGLLEMVFGYIGEYPWECASCPKGSTVGSGRRFCIVIKPKETAVRRRRGSAISRAAPPPEVSAGILDVWCLRFVPTSSARP